MKIDLVIIAIWMTIMMAFAAPVAGGVDAPQLSGPGEASVGVMSKHVVHRAQVDPVSSVTQGKIVTRDRPLDLLIWYPAAPGGRPSPYVVQLTAQPPLPPKAFSLPATAVRDAMPQGERCPVVVMSHGFANDPAMMSWIGENLASKRYVVVAIAHADPAYTDRTRIIEPIVWRPLDVAFVVQQIRGGLLGRMADPGRIGLIGYSLGGYGVLTAAGARLDPAEAPFQALPKGVLARYSHGGSEAGAMDAGDIKAVIAISPAGRSPFSTWGQGGLSGLRHPLLIIVGDQDHSVGFDPGPATIFAESVNSPRTLLVFKEAGHSIGVDAAPQEMRGNLWDQAWFEDPVWRKDRVQSISLHFITAFLDLHLKGDSNRADFLRVSNPNSDQASWNATDAAFDAVSQGGSNTAWKGFVRNQQAGLILRQLDPQD